MNQQAKQAEEPHAERDIQINHVEKTQHWETEAKYKVLFSFKDENALYRFEHWYSWIIEM